MERLSTSGINDPDGLPPPPPNPQGRLEPRYVRGFVFFGINTCDVSLSKSGYAA